MNSPNPDPLRWSWGDPEPDERVQVVRTKHHRWRRITPRGWNPAYCWFNGDKYRPWVMLVANHGPVFNMARLSRMHSLYGRKKRRRSR